MRAVLGCSLNTWGRTERKEGRAEEAEGMMEEAEERAEEVEGRKEAGRVLVVA